MAVIRNQVNKEGVSEEFRRARRDYRITMGVLEGKLTGRKNVKIAIRTLEDTQHPEKAARLAVRHGFTDDVDRLCNNAIAKLLEVGELAVECSPSLSQYYVNSARELAKYITDEVVLNGVNKMIDDFEKKPNDAADSLLRK